MNTEFSVVTKSPKDRFPLVQSLIFLRTVRVYKLYLYITGDTGRPHKTYVVAADDRKGLSLVQDYLHQFV